jgi:hypothetical protein
VSSIDQTLVTGSSGRESQIRQAVTETLSGILIGATTISEGHSKADAFTYLVTPRFKVSPDLMLYATWDDAVLTQAFPSTSTVYGVPGDRLPNSTRFSGNLSLQQDFRVTGRLTGFAGAAVSYVGDRVGTFTGPDLGLIFARKQ